MPINHSCSRFLALLALLGFAALAVVHPSTHAAVTEAWIQHYNGPANSNDIANAVAVDAGGNVVVSGSSHNGTNDNYYTAKYAAVTGALLWEKRYNGPANRDDYPWAMVLDNNGNVVVTGSSHNGTNDDYYTVKYAATNGTLLWENRYNGPANSNDVAYAVAVDGSGNVIVTGSSNNGTNDDFYTAKYAAANGALLWAKRYNGPVNSDDAAFAVTVDSNGNVIATGTSWGSNTGDYYTAKYASATGVLLWEKRYNAPNDGFDAPTAVAVDGGGNVVVTGYSSGFGEDNSSDYYTAKYAAATGALLWEKRYDWFDEDVPYAIAVDGSSNVVITGSSGTFKYAAADGALLWSRYDCFAKSLVLDGSGNVVVTGRTYGSNAVDSYTAKYAATDGALLWEIRADSPANKLEDIEHVLALGPNGMVVLTGTSEGTNGFDFATAVYREPLPPVSISLVPNGVRLRFPGLAGQSYQVLRAPTVAGPWSSNATHVAITNGLVEHLDTNALPGSAFYRTAVAP